MKVIIGAGISGLTLAFYLKKQNIDFQLLEESNKVGGAIHSAQAGEFLLETGPHTFQKTPAVQKLFDDLNFTSEIQETDPSANIRYILKNGKYKALPFKPLAFLFGNFFSWKDKWRIWKERSIPKGNIENESVDSFFRRRFGDFVADFVVNPFISGIYSGNAKDLLLETAFPTVFKMEKDHGSVIRGFLKQPKKKPAPIISIKNGNVNLPKKIASFISEQINLNVNIQFINPLENRTYEIKYNDQIIIADEIIFCIPAYKVANLISSFAPRHATALNSIEYPPISLVHTIFETSKIENQLPGFGALHPQIQNTESLGILFNNYLYPNKNPKGYSVFTSFVGGANFPEKTQNDNQKIINFALKDMSRYLKVKGKPYFQQVLTYEKSIPQYNLKHKKALEFLHLNPLENIHFCANWKDGISVPACIENAQKLSENIVN